VNIAVTNNPDAIADKVQALVTAVNDANSLIRSNSTYDSVNKKAGLLLSDQNASALSSALVAATTAGVSGGAFAPASVGISVSQTGVLSFDRTKFLAAYASNPDGVRQMFEANGATTGDDGIAERLRVAAASATDTATGRIQAALESREATARALDTQIANWDSRLAMREANLKRQFSALESALGRAQNQSSWLAGQLAQLPQLNRNS
jgi:flagellar hook-associated protein 2